MLVQKWGEAKGLNVLQSSEALTYDDASLKLDAFGAQIGP